MYQTSNASSRKIIDNYNTIQATKHAIIHMVNMGLAGPPLILDAMLTGAKCLHDRISSRTSAMHHITILSSFALITDLPREVCRRFLCVGPSTPVPLCSGLLYFVEKTADREQSETETERMNIPLRSSSRGGVRGDCGLVNAGGARPS